MKTVQINGVAGLRNDVSTERFGTGDLLSAQNIDIDETGKVFRRLGTNQLSPDATSSLFAAPGAMYYVRDDKLYETDLVHTKELVSGVGNDVCYHELNGKVFWSDGAQNGIIESGVSRMWGHEVPPSTFNLSIASRGDMRRGTYGVTIVYDRNGVEGGACRARYIELPAAGGIRIDNIPVPADPTITNKRVYITPPDGEAFFLAANLHPVDTAMSIYAEHDPVLPLRTAFKGPLPAGYQIARYAGRLFVVAGDVVWHTDPFEYELCDRRYNFLQFPSPVMVFAPVGDGVFVATETETVFLAGRDPDKFESTVVAQAGGVRGTLQYPEPARVGKDGVQNVAALWTSTAGAVVGLTGGQLLNLTSGRYVMPEARKGAGLLKIRSGTPQYVATLFK